MDKMIKQNLQYKTSPVKITIPVLKVIDKMIQIEFNLLFKSNRIVDTVIESCKILLPSGEILVSDSIYKRSNSTRENVLLEVPFTKEFLKKNVQIIVRCITNSEVVEVNFLRNSAGETVLYNISELRMTPADFKTFQKVKELGIIRQNRLQNQEKDFSNFVDESENVIPKSQQYHNDILKKYTDAVYREMLYLRHNGGRKYKVSNGVQITSQNGVYSYGFELESELFLSDDAPVKLIVGSQEVEGYVIVCEDFEIILAVDADFGNSISSAFIAVEPWKLLESLNKRLNQISRNDKLVVKLLEEGPKLGRQPAKNIAKGQSLAKEKAKSSDITIIWGPPGTGKTHTMAEIALDFMKQQKSILVVSHSNVSVDGVLNKVVQMLPAQKKKELLKQGKILRYGFVRDEELEKEPYAVSFNYVLLNHPTEKEKMERLQKEKAKLKNTGRFSKEREQVEKELKAIRKYLKDEEKQAVKKAQIVSTTISKVYADKMFEGKKYDVVMFDEVSMAYIPQIICAASHAESKFICVGDFYQLAPIVQADKNDVLKKDIFSYLNITDGALKIYGHPWLVMLDEQRRMHPDIAAFSNQYMYHKQLKNHKSVLTNREAIVNRNPFAGYAMNLLDLSGSYCAAGKTADNSRFNILQGIVSFSTAITAEKSQEQSVGIITPYAAQTRLIRAMILDYRLHETTEIACSTVHQFQGSERNVIIFDSVESYPSGKPGWLMSKDENSSLTRLINVAVTRAKGKLITVANRSFWVRKFQNSRNIFYFLVLHLLERGNVTGAKEQKLSQYFKTMDTGRLIKYYESRKVCLTDLQKDIANAKTRIIVSIPDGNLDAAYADTLLKSLLQAKYNGVQLLIKTMDYEKLPEHWKVFCWESDNAVFPLIAIDDTAIWYDVPFANSKFVDGPYISNTVCSSIFRITGQHTVEMIHSLAGLPMRTNGDIVTHMQPKDLVTANSKTKQSNKKERGLAAYIEKHMCCSECSQPLQLTRSAKGTVYLKCPDCKHMEYLTTAMVKEYLLAEKVRCPQHGSMLSVHLGKQGVYLRCKEGHFLKPDEI